MDTMAFRGLGEGGRVHFTVVLLQARRTFLKPVSDHVTSLLSCLPELPCLHRNSCLPPQSPPLPVPADILNRRAFHSTYLLCPHSDFPSRNAGCGLLWFLFFVLFHFKSLSVLGVCSACKITYSRNGSSAFTFPRSWPGTGFGGKGVCGVPEDRARTRIRKWGSGRGHREATLGSK